MKIAVIGAAGNVGSRVVAEALRRGHDVLPLTSRDVDAYDTAGVTELLTGYDAGVGATRQVPGDEGRSALITRSLLDAHAAAGVRFLMVGGAGTLHVPGGDARYVADDPHWVPAGVRALAAAAIDQLQVCSGHPDADWTYVAPSAVMEPGLRSGHYHVGASELLVDETGNSYISMEDMAVAILDELEVPTHRGTHFTVAGGVGG